MVKRLAVLMVVAACGTFEDPAIVLDLRPIALGADIPEQVVTVDLTHPVTADEVLVQLVDARVGVLLSDRHFARNIRWSAELCNLTDGERCDHANPYEELGSGLWPDPDDETFPPFITVPADGNLLGILLDELQSDPLHGLGGISYGVSVRFGGEDADPELDQYAAKSLMVSPAIPAGRTPNQNPTLDHIDATTGVGVAPVTRPLSTQTGGHCGDGTDYVEMPATSKLRLEPIETTATRETYSVPTIDGMTRTFTEAVTYQWIATAGKFSSANTGGGHDVFGNLMPVHTDWTAPAARDLDPSGNVQMWIIQRDERLGVALYEVCVHVTP